MRYAISAVPGHERETAGAHPADGCERIDPELGRYEVSAYVEAASDEAAHEAAMRYYGLLSVGDRVEGGTGEDHDTGRIERIEGGIAFVAWDSGVKTPADLSSLTKC